MISYKRPPTFQDNQDYFLREHDTENPLLVFSRIAFLAYDPCPAFIVVRKKEKPIRCSRDDLFSINAGYYGKQKQRLGLVSNAVLGKEVLGEEK